VTTSPPGYALTNITCGLHHVGSYGENQDHGTPALSVSSSFPLHPHDTLVSCTFSPHLTNANIYFTGIFGSGLLQAVCHLRCVTHSDVPAACVYHTWSVIHPSKSNSTSPVRLPLATLSIGWPCWIIATLCPGCALGTIRCRHHCLDRPCSSSFHRLAAGHRLSCLTPSFIPGYFLSLYLFVCLPYP
jgi:hypothetical protein